jgi:N-formylglutamate deformylase
MTLPWLHVSEGSAPMIMTFPHVGEDLVDVADQFRSIWLARRDADWWVDHVYAFARDAEVTLLSTDISRSVIDVNRDPSGASLYPGQATTDLCPIDTFDGEPLYAGAPPCETEIARRRRSWFDPYHAELTRQIERLRAKHKKVVVYDAHSIRSRVPRLFHGLLPQFNIGTNNGYSCDPALADAVWNICEASGLSHVLDGRFKGGWTTRHYGKPETGVHAIQLELAMRGYLTEPDAPTPQNWPPPFDPEQATQVSETLASIVKACLAFARS